jgi:hypothetical protein
MAEDVHRLVVPDKQAFKAHGYGHLRMCSVVVQDVIPFYKKHRF